MKIRLENVVKRFDDNTAVDNFSAVIESGELVTLLGPSGCGKSTMLNMLSGILYPTEGKIYFDDDDVTYMPSDKRGVGLVFQNYALYPHMTVYDNMAFGLRNRHMPKDEIHKRVMDAAKILDIEEYLDRKPKAMSGGQRQRLAIARAMLKKPDILILDEVLAVGDGAFRRKSESKMIEIIRNGTTTLLVSHSVSQVRKLCNKVLWLDHGRQMNFGSTKTVCDAYEEFLNQKRRN